MQRLLGAALAALLAFSGSAWANSTPGNLGVATTNLSGGKLPFDQGPGTDTALGFVTTVFCLATGNLTICNNGITLAMLSGLGANVATALGVNVGTPGAFVVNGGALGTPSSGNVGATAGYQSANLVGNLLTTNFNSGTNADASHAWFGDGTWKVPSGSTGVGVDGGTAEVTVTASCTIGSGSGACASASIRRVNIGAIAAPTVITLPAIAAVSNDTCIKVQDAGANVGSTNTVTLTANAADGINNGAGGSSTPAYPTAQLSVTVCVSATHNWTIDNGQLAPPAAGQSYWGVANNMPLPKTTRVAYPVAWQATVNPANANLLVHSETALTITTIYGRPEVSLGGTGTVDVYDVASTTTCSAASTKVTTTAFDANATAGTDQNLLSAPYSLASGHSLCLKTTGSNWATGTSQATLTAYGYPS